jgi:hypothetical protein
VQRQLLNSQNADGFRRLLHLGQSPGLHQLDGATLAGAMELFATANSDPRASYVLDSIYQAARENDLLWLPLTTEWERKTAPSFGKDVFGKRKIEFYRIRTSTDQTSECFTIFQHRFVKNLTLNSFPSDFALGLSKVFSEMTDNVVQHSGPLGEEFSGLAGYHVSANFMSFAVTDIGRGALARLRDSTDWRHLNKASDALHAIVHDSASSRAGQGPGEGFRQLFRTLVDRNVAIRLRTDDAAMRISDATHAREAASVISPPLPGFQMSVACALDRPAAEEPIKFGCVTH